jgi:hypothetical protein
MRKVQIKDSVIQIEEVKNLHTKPERRPRPIRPHRPFM